MDTNVLAWNWVEYLSPFLLLYWFTHVPGWSRFWEGTEGDDNDGGYFAASIESAAEVASATSKNPAGLDHK